MISIRKVGGSPGNFGIKAIRAHRDLSPFSHMYQGRLYTQKRSPLLSCSTQVRLHSHKRNNLYIASSPRLQCRCTPKTYVWAGKLAVPFR